MLNMLTFMMLKAQNSIENFFKKEDGEVNIIAIVVLIGIAILLAVVFKGKIVGLLNSLFGSLEQKGNDAILGNI